MTRRTKFGKRSNKNKIKKYNDNIIKLPRTVNDLAKNYCENYKKYIYRNFNQINSK